jgi:ribosomal protein L37AE/L43A
LKKTKLYVKIICPKCKKIAELAMDFSLVTCENCDLEMSYGEYIKFIAHNEQTYSDILGDYTGSTEGQSSGSLDEWD